MINNIHERKYHPIKNVILYFIKYYVMKHSKTKDDGVRGNQATQKCFLLSFISSLQN